METVRAIIANPEHEADLFWRTGFWAPDPLIYLEVEGEGRLLVNDLELSRAMESARVAAEPSTPYADRLRQTLSRPPLLADILHAYLEDRGLGTCELLMPGSTAARQVDRLRELGHSVRLADSPFWPERRHKTAQELASIEEALRHTERVMAMARKVIWGADINGDRLFWEGSPLTSERVRSLIQVELLTQGFAAGTPIVACGEQATMPHERGSGPLLAHQPIVVDIFPTSLTTRYSADMTRTVVRGRVRDELARMHQAVADAVRTVLDHLRPGADGKDLHQMVVDLFDRRGFATGTVDGRPQGFIHGTGHGVGLDIHEPPRISKDSQVLEEGDVVTVEPGLYYPGVGGVRIEELVVVTSDGCRDLCTLDWNLTP